MQQTPPPVLLAASCIDAYSKSWKAVQQLSGLDAVQKCVRCSTSEAESTEWVRETRGPKWSEGDGLSETFENMFSRTYTRAKRPKMAETLENEVNIRESRVLSPHRAPTSATSFRHSDLKEWGSGGGDMSRGHWSDSAAIILRFREEVSEHPYVNDSKLGKYILHYLHWKKNTRCAELRSFRCSFINC